MKRVEEEDEDKDDNYRSSVSYSTILNKAQFFGGDRGPNGC